MTPDLDESLSSFSAVVGGRTGIIKSVEFVPITERDPCVFLAYAEPANTVPITGIRAANRGAACATTSDRAALRACGEAIERYSSAIFDFQDLELATEIELENSGRNYISTSSIYPFSSVQYAEDQFPFAAPDVTHRYRWKEGQYLTGESVQIPASCVYVPYLFEPGVEPFSHMPISTGLAAGRSIPDCIEKGICEILERDALMIVWLNRKPVPRIRAESCVGISSEIDALLRAGTSGLAKWHINLLTLDVCVPVVSAALIDKADKPLTSFGISADANPSLALRGALEEALLTRLLVNRMPQENEDPEKEIRTLKDHLTAHANRSDLRLAMSFLVDEGPEIAWDSVDRRFRGTLKATEECMRKGLRPAWTEVTTADLADLGFKVVRSIVPTAQPLDSDHKYRYLGGVRLREVPASMGWPQAVAFNSDPHPFP